VGAAGAEVATGHTSMPPAVSRFALGSGAWALLHRVNNAWELVPYANHCYHVTLSASIAAGTSGSVTLPDGRSETATNWSSDANLQAGDKCLCFQDLTNGSYYLLDGGRGPAETAVVSVYAPDADEGNCLWPGKVMLIDSEGGPPTAACSTPFVPGDDCWLLVINSDGGSWQSPKLKLKVGEHYIGRKVFSIGVDPAVPVYAIRHTPKPATVLYRGQLSGTLLHGSATCSVGSLQSYSEQPAPLGTITANNIRKFAGAGGQTCVVIENNSVTPPTYDLLAVEWDELERVSDLSYVSPTLTEHKRKFLGKNTDSETTEDNSLFTPTLQSLVTDVAYNATTHELQKTVRVASVLSLDAPATSTVLAATTTTWLSDLDFDAELGLDATVKTAHILGEVTGTSTLAVADMHTVVAVGDVDFDGDDLTETPVTLKFLGKSTWGSAASFLETFEVLVMTNSLVNGGMSELQKTTRNVRVVGIPGSSTTSTVVDLVETTVVVDSLVNGGVTELQKATRNVRVVGAPSGSTTSAVIPIDDCSGG
jgi:hypothetical protein